MIVQKYGGSSVGTPEKIKSVAARIARARASGQDVVVVVSAMGDTTDELIELGRQVSPHSHEREMDVLLTAGERISMALLSMALRDQGQEAISFTGSQAGIITDESHTRARIIEIRPTRVKEELARGKVVIVAGFQGVSRAKEITTLGRGGSDTTAVAMAAALEASRCEVYTDVPGIFSADPRIVPAARRYERLPLGLVHELASAGAQVMHARSIEIARTRGFSIYVGRAHPAPGRTETEEGTILLPDKMATGLELPGVVAVTAKTGLCELAFAAGAGEAALSELARGAVLVHNVVLTPGGGLSLVVDGVESRAFVEKHGSAVIARDVTAATIVGRQLQNNTVIAARLIEVLEGAGIKPSGLTCHPQSITVWFSESSGSRGSVRAVQLLHETFIGE